MRKKLLVIGILSFAGFMANAQVGINTNQPQATLDVVGFPGIPGKLDGVIAPRLIGTQLRAKNYTAAQTGAMVYVTAADTAPAGQTINVTSPGYYYFNGTVWVQTTPAQSFDWKTTGNTDAEITTSAETLGNTPVSANYLGTQGAADDLVIVTGNKVHGVLDINGTMKGGNSNPSAPYASISWGSNNTLSNNSSSNVALGRENTVAAQAANFPGVAIGSGNSALSGAKVIGNDNFATDANTVVLGNRNGTASANVLGINVGNLNVNSGGFAFGTGNTVTTNNYAFGNANTANGSGAIAFGFQAQAIISDQTVYANTMQTFSGKGTIGTAITDVGVNMTPSSTNIPDLEVSKGILIKPATANPPTASDCDASNEGAIVYAKTGTTGNFYGCRISSGVYGWQQF